MSSRQAVSVPDPDHVATVMRRVAAEEILPRYEKLERHEISDKQSGEIVTAADTASERRLEVELAALLVDSVAVGEEAYEHDRTVVERLGEAAPVWVIDPLDGTRNFAEGKPCFAVIVALCHAGRTLAGWIYDPLADDIVWAVAGEGAWDASGRIVLARPAPPLADMRGSLGKRARERLEEEATRSGRAIPAEMLRYRCVGREYVDLARGRLDFAVYGNLKPWDHAAGTLIYTEAGGHAAFAADARPYRPGPIADGRFILTHDAARWRELRDLLATVLS